MTQFGVAQFPWDPKPEAEAAASNGTAASQGKTGASSSGKGASPSTSADNSFSQPIMSPMAGSQGGSLALPGLPMPAFEPSSMKAEDSDGSGNGNGGPHIKMEPDLQSHLPMPAPPLPSFPSGPGGVDNAAARAAAMLSKEFGSAANASINALNTQQQQQQQQGRGHLNGVSKSQLDGSADADEVAESSISSSSSSGAFEGILLQQQRAGQPPVELGRVEIDNLLHEQMARRAKQMEGGGLMLSLKQQAKQSKQSKQAKRERKRRAVALPLEGTTAQPRAPIIAQVDGVDDDDEDVKGDILNDEDAINSDLDDPEDDREDDDDDDDVMGPIMLCVYDKVQRVKNKWCVKSARLLRLFFFSFSLPFYIYFSSSSSASASSSSSYLPIPCSMPQTTC